MSELASAYAVHLTMIHRWKKSVLEGAAGIFERGGQASAATKIAEETVRDLHAKIGDLAVAHVFLSRNLKPWIGPAPVLSGQVLMLSGPLFEGHG